MNPRRAIVEERVRARLQIMRLVNDAEGDVDLVRPALALEEQGRSTFSAEGPRRRRRALVARERVAAVEVKTLSLDAHPRHRARAVRAPAHRAMTVRDPLRRALDVKRHRATQTCTGE